jgi:MATE family multidrug resistance protein
MQAWEVVGIASAYLGTANLGANSVLGTSASLLYQLPYGLCVATAVRVGNLVGAGFPHAAKTSAHVALAMSVVISVINSTLLLALKKNWGRLFSSDDVVIRIVADIMPLVGLFQLADGVTAAAMGVLRGTGLAPLGAQINLIGYWVIGIPLGMVLTFHPKLRLGLYGLWTGLSAALLFTAIGAVVVIYKIKWTKLVKQITTTKVDETEDGVTHENGIPNGNERL